MMRSVFFLLVFLPYLLLGQGKKNIVAGMAVHQLFWMQTDTVESVIKYAYFDPAKDPAEEAANFEIHNRHRLWVLDTSRLSAPLNAAYFENLLHDFYALSESEPNQYNEPWRVQMSTEIKPYKRFVQLTISGWEYAGGVHGNGTSFSWQYDRKDGHRIQLNEFFSDTAAVNAIFEKHFREQMELAPEASLNESEFWFDDGVFSLNDNYFLRGKEFVIYFNTYEISSYAMGPIEIAVPLKELKDYLILRF